jgi:GT2 family glycosyltransferase
MKLALVIVSYNSYDDIVKLLSTIKTQERKPDHIIIVDNASPNGDGVRLQELSKEGEFDCICAERNGGFAYACNIGMSMASELGATHIWLINPDATLPDARYLEKVERAFDTSDYDMIGTYVVNRDSQEIEFWWADIWLWTLYPSIRQRWLPYSTIIPSDQVVETDYATGSSLFFSLALYDDIGALDESYFMYFEETDYCLRAREKWYKIGITSDTYIDHATSSSVGRMSWFYVRYMIVNYARFAWHHARWYQWPGWLIVYICYWIPGFTVSYLSRKIRS